MTRVILLTTVGPRAALDAARELARALPVDSDDVVARGWIYGAVQLEAPAGSPLRAPHYTVGDEALLGTMRRKTVEPPRYGRRGREIDKGSSTTYFAPGEVSLAHGGVLYLQDLVEFRRSAIERLGETIRAGCVTRWSLSSQTPFTVPAAPAVVIATTAPCPCGAGAGCSCCSDRRRRWTEWIERNVIALRVTERRTFNPGDDLA